MDDTWTFALTVFTGFFAIMNPIANTPIFMGLVTDADEKEKKRIARLSTLTAFIIVASFVILGKYIFQLFGLTIPAFKLAGGILVFFVGFEMLQSKKSSIQHQKEVKIDEGIAISPLAIPILAGPGTVITAMNFVTDGGILQIGIVLLVFAIMIVLTYLAFVFSEALVKLIGNNMIVVIAKLMGLILTIIGLSMVIEGIKLGFNLTT